MLRNYKIGFDARGLLLFLIIMAPNLVWSAVGAPDDILSTPSVTPVLDAVQSVCQVLMTAALCAVRKRTCPRRGLSAPFFAAGAVCCLLYLISWAFYFTGTASAAVILVLTIFPCAAFILFAAGRGNMPALTLAAVFSACHLAHTVINFIL